ncbi:XK-related protein 8.3 isoform X2 [Oncorhynchus tshawytscha]|uniref:XK-related protein 8.3 isoform X2 n=1 Tax=Oncorhynchus tshawytscha TaxID=74940 RepID=UPI001C3E1A30|nr:XK-related protein 8.3 isoform X2 [Oncorhynchus tshawytscha]
MDSPMFSKYSWLDFLFSVVGVCTFLFDVGSDIWVATEFYSRGDFFWFGVLIGLMVLSSVVVQMFSWFWFKYDRELEGFDEQTAKNVLFGGCVKLSFLLHVLQLGFFCRHISAIWQGFRVWWRQEQGSGYAVYLTHDLSMLRLIETFCESAPQLTLMTHIMLHTNKARTVQCESPLHTSLHTPTRPGRYSVSHLYTHQQGQDSTVCECRGVNYFHSLDGGGLSPLPAFLPPRQGQAGLGLRLGLLPVEPAPHRAARGSSRPLRHNSALLPGCPLPAYLASAGVLGVAAGDRLHGQRRRRMALPGHRRSHLVLQLVQRGGGRDQKEEHHLSLLHGYGRRDSACHMVVLQRPGPDTVLRPHPAGHSAPHLPDGSPV